MLSVGNRNKIISIFVIAWLALFNYESLRASYLSPMAGYALPKFKFLFPPAGWIMFYSVGETEGRTEVYGAIDEKLEAIDPHRIFENRWIGYDNIRRNVLVSVLYPQHANDFCRYLHKKFPEYDQFEVLYVTYPSNVKYPNKRVVRKIYGC